MEPNLAFKARNEKILFLIHAELYKFLILVKIFPVSHLKERKEKICLNCHTALTGRYCHVCGQENLEPKETVWHLVQHFFNDITHFDGKFFSSVKYLMRKPGFLSKEYMSGRRASYLNPIRMYVFTSAIFFLIFFSLTPKNIMKINESPDKDKAKTVAELVKMKLKAEKDMKTDDDEDDRKDAAENARKLGIELAVIKNLYGDTTTRTFTKQDRKLLLAQALMNGEGSGTGGDTSKGYRYAGPAIPPQLRDSLNRLPGVSEIRDTNSRANFFGMEVGQYRSVEAYDSIQRSLPDSLRDGWLTKVMKHRFIAVNEEVRRDKRSYMQHVGENILHSFPKILFFSLPFFALILNVLYFRHKQYYYVDHGIFSIHLYCATFILSLATILLQKLYEAVDLKWFTILGQILIFGLVLYMLIYLYKAMRGFYGQGRGKTFLKYLITCLLAFIVNTILLIIFVLISAVEI